MKWKDARERENFQMKRRLEVKFFEKVYVSKMTRLKEAWPVHRPGPYLLQKKREP